MVRERKEEIKRPFRQKSKEISFGGRENSLAYEKKRSAKKKYIYIIGKKK